LGYRSRLETVAEGVASSVHRKFGCHNWCGDRKWLRWPQEPVRGPQATEDISPEEMRQRFEAMMKQGESK